MYRTCVVHLPIPCAVSDAMAQEGNAHPTRAVHDRDMENSHATDADQEDENRSDDG